MVTAGWLFVNVILQRIINQIKWAFDSYYTSPELITFFGFSQLEYVSMIDHSVFVSSCSQRLVSEN